MGKGGGWGVRAGNQGIRGMYYEFGKGRNWKEQLVGGVIVVQKQGSLRRKGRAVGKQGLWTMVPEKIQSTVF